MMPPLRTALLGAALLLGPVGCSGGHGFLGTDYEPKGNITVVNVSSGAAIATTQSAPYDVTASAFTVGITETNYQGPYTVTMTSWNNGFDEPCFGFSTDGAGPNQSFQTNPSNNNTVTFTPINANSPTAPASQPNPCVVNDGDIEGAQISDGKGNTAYFYFELT